MHGTNAETRWEALRDQGYFTPNERFFVRNHTSTPAIDPATWRLQVFGSGLRDPEGIELSYDDLLALPSRSVVSAVECAGNGRSLFADQQGNRARGTAWKLGAIGVARWRGVPLSVVLHRAGLRRRGAVDVMAQGLDATVAKSAFELPWDAQLPGGRQRLSGRSWSGTSSIRRVEVSTDGGASWRQVRTRPGDDRRGWQRSELDWRPPSPGSYELLARATDRAGQTQPDTVPFNDNSYQFWAVARHPVTVAA